MTVPGPAASAPRAILVVQTSFLGDVVLSTPVFAELKRHWPASRLAVMVRPDAAAALEGHPHVDEVLVLDKRGRDRGLSSLFRVAASVRARQFDLAIGLQKSIRTALMLALAGVPRRVGFARSEAAFLYHARAKRDESRHDIDRQLAILSALGLDYDESQTRPLLVVNEKSRTAVRDLLQRSGLRDGASYVALAPGSAWETKRWTPEGYAAVAAAVRNAGDEIVYLGAPSEVAVVENVRRLAGVGISLAGATDTGGLVAAVAGARALVCNDSAPMHIAQALGVPLVAIFGPTSPRQGFGPRFPPSVIVQEETLDCRPCCRHGGHHCPLGTHACMKGIDTGRVLAALSAVGANGRGLPRVG